MHVSGQNSYVEALTFRVAVFRINWVSGGSVVKNPPANAEDRGSIPGSGRFPERGNGNPLWYSSLGNPKGSGGLQSTGLQRVRHD